jgi:enamine deaminase RidA (YjgF/YER057c/UK114 family)
MAAMDERLKSLGIVLPDVMPPVVDGYVPAFAPFARSGDQIHLSGRLGKEDGKPLCGKVGEEISLEQGKLAARGVAIELLAVLKAAAGDFDNVRRIVKLLVMWSMARRTSQNLTVLRMGHLSYWSKYSASGASMRAVPLVWRRCHSARASKST